MDDAARKVLGMLKTLAANVRRAWKKLLLIPDHQKHPDFTRAVAWYQNFTPIDDDASEFKLRHAENMYADATTGLHNVDRKAEFLLQFDIGAAAAIVTLLTAVHPAREAAWYFVPALLFLMASVLCAFFCRKTVFSAGRMGIDKLVDEQRSLNQLQQLLAASLHCAVAGIKVATDEKADWYDRATWAAIIAVLLLPLPLFPTLISQASEAAAPEAAEMVPLGRRLDPAWSAVDSWEAERRVCQPWAKASS